MSSIARGQKMSPFSDGLPHNKVAALVARQASFVQLKYSQDAHEDKFATVFVVMEVNMETARFFCFDLKESEAMQITTLFLFPGKGEVPSGDSDGASGAIAWKTAHREHHRWAGRGCSRWWGAKPGGRQPGHVTGCLGGYSFYT